MTPLAAGSSAVPLEEEGNTDTYRSLLGKRVRAIRKAQHRSQAEVALAAGFSRKTVIGIEAGSKNLQFETLLRLMRALRLHSLEQLMSGIPQWGSDQLADKLFGSSPEEQERPATSA